MVHKTNGQFSKVDFTNHRNGKLLWLKPTGKKDKDGSSVWFVKCDCGKTIQRPSSRFNAIKSCGSLECKGSGGQFKVKNFKGERINDCTVLHQTEKRVWGYAVWEVRCHLCNQNFERPSYAIIKNTLAHRCREWLSKYHPRIGRPPLPESQSHINGLYTRCKKSARERDLDFELRKDEFKKISEMPCKYCGEKPILKKVYSQLYGQWAFNGIDRIDNSKGYISGNCAPCCGTCNMAKSTMTVSEFAKWIKKIYLHFASKTTNE